MLWMHWNQCICCVGGKLWLVRLVRELAASIAVLNVMDVLVLVEGVRDVEVVAPVLVEVLAVDALDVPQVARQIALLDVLLLAVDAVAVREDVLDVLVDVAHLVLIHVFLRMRLHKRRVYDKEAV